MSHAPPLQPSGALTQPSLPVCGYVDTGWQRTWREPSNREGWGAPASHGRAPAFCIRTVIDRPRRHLEACGYHRRQDRRLRSKRTVRTMETKQQWAGILVLIAVLLAISALNRVIIFVTYMAGSADRMRIHQTAIWRVRHKRPFSVHSTGTPPKLTGPTFTQTFLAHPCPHSFLSHRGSPR
jgi:hypothetical protein